MLHREILGSFERFIGILLENTTGRLPLWLAPTQIVIASITTNMGNYIHEVASSFKKVGLRCKVDDRNEKINYKVREHSLAKIPYILVCGKKEMAENTVTVRKLGSDRQNVVKKEELIENMLDLNKLPLN